MPFRRGGSISTRVARSPTSAKSRSAIASSSRRRACWCLCVLDHKSGAGGRGPERLCTGVAGLDDSRLAQARQAALDALAELGPAQRTDHGMVEEALRRAVRSAWKKGLEKRPMVLPVVLEM